MRRNDKRVTVTVRQSPESPGDLCGVAEAALILDVAPSQVTRWVRRGEFPDPLSRLAATPVWYRSWLVRERRRRARLALARDRSNG